MYVLRSAAHLKRFIEVQQWLLVGIVESNCTSGIGTTNYVIQRTAPLFQFCIYLSETSTLSKVG